MDAATRTRRREAYDRWSSPVVFLLGMLFLVGVVEIATSEGATSTGVWLVGVTWVGFLIDLVVLWILDDNPASYPKRHALGFVAVLVPAFRALMAFYVFVRLARGRVRLQTRVQLYALYLTILVITFGAALVLSAERSYPGSSIHTYGEAVWWAAVTVTTVGYGDYVPVSPIGRGLATLMLVNGVVIISVITATVSSRFVSAPDPGERAVTLDDLDDRLARIEAALMLRTATTSAEGDTDDETASPS